MSTPTVPAGIDDPVNTAILAVSEDRIQGFRRDPIGDIAAESGIEPAVVIERIQAMLEAGTIRRVRQTMLSTNLAKGALVAWQVPDSRLQESFDYLFKEDPFSGHVVIRTADPATPGSSYRLWTTLKVPQGYSIQRHCEYLAGQIDASAFRTMPAKKLFVLGVGHTRRRNMQPGDKAETPAVPIDTQVVELDDEEWRVLVALKREFAPEELQLDLWTPRAAEAGVPLERFLEVAEALDGRGVIGRFSTFLEHVKPVADGQRVTRYNALFHWAVPHGREVEAGMEVGRHHIMTHAYWREGGPEFRNVNVMGVVHGMEKATVLEHKAAIDARLEACGIPVSYTNVFWGGRSEIKPSEIAPQAYREWCEAHGIDPETMRETPGEG
ncbi:MAG: Lrp/AsnC family transcriptional regulator [Dehalococcoidia bacterium]|nr:Lrp/AsnC family transcriptional regulator [Dehalococcoidia bacterium]